MADVDVILVVGSSNFAGFLALLDDVPTLDLTRWLGSGSSHPPIPSVSSQRPYEARIPGGRIWAARRPFSNNVSRAIAANTTLTAGYLNSGAMSASAKKDSWVYVRTNSTGQGNFRKLDTAAATNILATVTTPWSPSLSPDGTIHFLLDSHTTETHTVGQFDSSSGITGNTITVTAHGLKSGDQITITGTVGATGLALNTTYYIINPTVDTFQVSRSPGGTVVTLTSGGAQTLTVLTNSTSTVLFKTSATDAITSAVTANGGRHVLVLGAIQAFTATAKFDATFPNTVIRAAAHGLAANTRLHVVSTATLPGGLVADTDYYVRTAHSFAVTVGNTLDAVAHGFVNGARVRASGVSGLTAGIDYFIINATANTFQVSLTLAGSAVVFSPVAGTFTFTTLDDFKLTTTAGGTTLISFADAGTGTHSFQTYDDTVRKVTAFTATSITLDVALTPPPPGSCFCILSGANSCESLATMQSPNAVLQDLTFYLDQNAPVYLTGLDYYIPDSTPFQSPRVAYAAGPTVNLMPELQYHLRSRLANLVIVPMTVSASMISPFLNGQVFGPAPVVPFGGFTSWFHDILSLDFHPSSPSSLYTALTNAITSATALIVAEGNKPRFRGLILNLFDNDPTADAQRAARLGSNAVLFRDALRVFVGEPSMPCALSGPSTYAGTEDQRELVYDTLWQVAASDPAGTTSVTDTRSNTNKAIDGLHYNALGQILLAQQNFATWDPIYSALVDDTAAANSMGVEISNIALSYIGETAKVFSLDVTVDQSTQARVCAQFYPEAFKHTREAHSWAFATTVKALEAVVKDDLRTDWAFAYLPPPDMDTPIRVVSPGATTTSGEVPPWWRFPNAENVTLMKVDDPDYEIEVDSSGRRVLYTNVEAALLKYNKRMSSKTLVPHSFKLAVARRLAAFISGPTRKDIALTEKLEAMARIETGDAAAIDANRQQKGPPPDRMPWNRG